jgi:PKHD-type hydroxylase
MILSIPHVLSSGQVREARHLLDAADWVDGKVTAATNRPAPRTTAVAEESPVARQLGARSLRRWNAPRPFPHAA